MSCKISDDECPICLDNCNNKFFLSCSHFYHKKCLKDWFDRGDFEKKCPLCNLSIKINHKKYFWEKGYENTECEVKKRKGSLLNCFFPNIFKNARFL